MWGREDAWRVFNRTPTCNVVSWNALLSGHVRFWGRTEGTIETLSTIATRRGTGRLCQLCWGAQCLCTIVAALMEML